MRALRVLGMAENGAHLVCVGEEHADGEPETFLLPLDDRLRAAARGDLSRFGQLEIEMEPQLRPREIQSRIRAGASVEQVAAAAGCTPERIERYAYPVLMERSTIADRARRVHPLQGAAMGSLGAASSARTLQEIVTATIVDRGQQPDVTWDAFRDERGWTVTVTWHAGRSENRAEWAYHAGPDGGAVTARNQEAKDLVEPAPRALRTVDDRSTDQAHRSPRTTAARTTAARTTAAQTTETPDNETPATVTPATVTPTTVTPATVTPATVTPTTVTPATVTPATVTPATAMPASKTPETAAAPTPKSSTPSADRADDPVADVVRSTVTDERSGARPPASSPRETPAIGHIERTGTDDAAATSGAPSDRADRPGRTGTGRSAQRGHRPAMPSWEDVLLGTRASGR